MAAPHSPLPRTPRLSAAARRDQLAQVAAQRFHELGYHRVALGDVAAEAGVTGPAVYRHFRNKEALLAAAISSGLDHVEEAVVRGSDSSLDDLVSAVAEVALRRPDMWVLLQRESRFLGPELRAPVLEQFARIVDRFSRGLRRERPDLAPDDARLLVTAATAVLSVPSRLRTSLAPAEHRRELASAALVCLRTELPDGPPRVDAPAVPPPDEAPRTRREQVVDTAIGLFFQRGYSGVSLDDIGAAVGIAGPSILHHFASKVDILVTAFDRTSEMLASTQARRRSSDGPTDLTAMVDTYTGFCLAHRSLVGVYVSEPIHLPEDAAGRAGAVVRTELRDWTRALLATSPDLPDRLARVRVRAALGAVNDLVRLGHFAERPLIRAEIATIATAVLRGGA